MKLSKKARNAGKALNRIGFRVGSRQKKGETGGKGGKAGKKVKTVSSREYGVSRRQKKTVGIFEK